MESVHTKGMLGGMTAWAMCQLVEVAVGGYKKQLLVCNIMTVLILRAAETPIGRRVSVAGGIGC